MDGIANAVFVAGLVALILRDYQGVMESSAIELMREGIRRLLLVAPTGGGKTALAASMIAKAMAKGKTIWFVCHRIELVLQASKTFTRYGIRHGIIAAGYPANPERLVQIVMIQTAARRVAKLTAPDAIYVDESHHIVSAQYKKIIEAFPKAFVIGVTATPARLDGRGLGEMFDEMVIGPSCAELIRDGWLSDYVLYGPSAPDMSSVGTVAGEYNQQQQAEIFDTAELIGDVVDNYLRFAAGTQAIVFAVNIKHSQDIVAAFNAAGIAAVHVDGDTEDDPRKRALEDFEARKYQVISNCALFGEGVDVPGIETVILARATQSLTIWLQAVGRGLRPVYAPGSDLSTAAGRLAGMAAGSKKRAILIDHGGNALRLGMPDAPREWSLDAKKRKSKLAPIEAVKTCPACFLIVKAAARRCICGHEFAPETVPPEHTADELVEMSRDPVEVLADEMAARDFEIQQRRREEWACTSVDELVELGRKRQYKHPASWAHHAWNRRKGKKRPAGERQEAMAI